MVLVWIRPDTEIDPPVASILDPSAVAVIVPETDSFPEVFRTTFLPRSRVSVTLADLLAVRVISTP